VDPSTTPRERQEETTMAQQQVQKQGRQIRRVTNLDVIRGKQGDGQTGTYQLELTLDGVDEYVLIPGDDEINTVLRLFQHSENALFDQRTEELTFEHYHG